MQHDTTARFLTDKALAELEQFRSRLRQSVHSQTTALSAALVRQFPGALAVTINGAALSADNMPELWTGTVHRLHVFAKEVGTDTSLLLLVIPFWIRPRVATLMGTPSAGRVLSGRNFMRPTLRR